MTTILIALPPESIPTDQLDRVRAIQPDAHLLITHQRDEIEELLPEIEIAAGDFPHAFIPRAPKLRWFQQWGAGTDWLIRHPEIAGRDFILTNASGVHAIPISEHILALMLAFARRLPESIHAQRQHKWLKHEDFLPSFELAGKTMLLVGVGAIGRRTAQVASALGMHVIGVRSRASLTVPGIERMIGGDGLHNALPEADFVVLTIPLTVATRHMFDANAFVQMKPGAYLINIGRGGTVNEGALIHALKAGQIAGAGLDVFEKEPLPEDSPLWDMENVIITAHYSGLTPHYNERAMGIFVDNLERFTRGEEMKNVVDKERGY